MGNKTIRSLVVLSALIFIQINSFANDKILDQKITISFKNKQLTEVIKSLDDKLGKVFSYRKDIIPKNKKVNSNFDNKSIRHILDKILKGTNLTYKEYAGKIILNKFIKEKELITSKKRGKQATINGFVMDEANGETIVGATVFIVGTKKGAYTNKSGYYSISGIEPRVYTVRLSFLGYETKEIEIEFKPGSSIRKDFSLKVEALTTDEVTVTADKVKDKREISISKVNIPIKQLREIRIGGEADVFRAMQMLPGVLTSSQISSGLYIRGGSPDQNLVLLDGATVYNPTHLFGFFSSFNTEAIKDVELIKGAYPAEYGSRLSSVINITQKDGNRKEYEGIASIGLISAKLSLEGPVGDGSFFIGGRRTYLDLLANLEKAADDENIPSVGFYDLNAKINQKISENDYLTVSGFYSNDFFDVDMLDIYIGLSIGNRSGAIKWTHIFGDNLFSILNFSGSRYVNGIDIQADGISSKIDNNINDFTLKGSFEYFATDKLTLKSGFEVTNYRFTYFSDLSDISDVSNDEGGSELILDDHIYSLFGQANYQFTDLFSLQGGLRTSYWNSRETLVFDPRLALRYQFNENLAMKASFGQFHQYLKLSRVEDFSLFDTWMPTDNSVEPSKATHYVLSFETTPFENYDLNFDLYYKDLDHINEQKGTVISIEEVSDLYYSGKGKAYGFEVFLQKKAGDFVGWIGYAYGSVIAQFDSINAGKEFRPKYDRRHDFKAVGQFKLSDSWDVSASFVFQTGQSYTGASSRFNINLPGQNIGSGKVIPSQKYGLRLPPSHQLNLNLNHYFEWFGLDWRFIIDIYNVYSKQDILMRTYKTDREEGAKVEDIKLLPIIPTVSLEVKF